MEKEEENSCNVLTICCFSIFCNECVNHAGPLWSWSYGISISNYLCNQCLSPLMLWIWIPLRWSVLDTTLHDKVCQWLAAGLWFSPGTLISSTNKTDCHDISERLLKVALNTMTHHQPPPTLLKLQFNIVSKKLKLTFSHL